LDGGNSKAPELGELLSHWTVYPSFLIGWLLLGAAYVAALILRRRADPTARVDLPRAAAFFAGWILLFLALQGPLHDLSDSYLFSAHMVQHLIITLVVPPLLLAGCPDWLLRPLVARARIARWIRALTRPIVAFALYNDVFTVWHIPALYDAMMRHHDLHIVMHLSIIASGLLLWWPVLSPLPELGRLSYGAQILYLFLLGIPMMALAALITLADHVVYPWYAAAPRLWGLTPRMDEQLGGLIMWVPGTLVLYVAMTIAFFKWSSQREDVGSHRGTGERQSVRSRR
jgi:putative membrane protein